jgi:Ca2+-dependent lipid-binding protein
MESRSIEITLNSARDLFNPNKVSKPKPYAVVWISNDYRNRKQTSMDKVNLTNPIWNEVMEFNLDEPALQQGRLDLEITIYTKATFKEKAIGRVSIPLNELVKLAGGFQGATTSAYSDSYPVQNPSGKDKGTINISVKLAKKPEVKLQAVAGSYGAGQDDAPVVPPVQQQPRMNTHGIRIMTGIISDTISSGLMLGDLISDGGFDGG